MTRTLFSTIETAVEATANGKALHSVDSKNRDNLGAHFINSEDLSQFEMLPLLGPSPQLAWEPMVS